jgi:hypothetical protein
MTSANGDFVTNTAATNIIANSQYRIRTMRDGIVATFLIGRFIVNPYL